MLKKLQRKLGGPKDSNHSRDRTKSSDKHSSSSSSSATPSKSRKAKGHKKSSGSSASSSAARNDKAAARAAGTASAIQVNEAPTMVSKAELLKPIATFTETSPTNRPALFIHKLRLCSIMFDWEEESSPKENRAKEVKRQQLLELVEHIGKNKNIYTDQVLQEIVKMVGTNLFRALPPRINENVVDADDDDPVFEPSWPHLQIVYEFFLRFIVSSDVDMRTLKKHVNGPFVLRILELFDSEDHRERDYLKTILHRIYAKFMSLRAFIRKAINNVFYTFIFDTERHNGVAELLEILGSIINGFALPLKQEHKTFLQRVLTPMHKVQPLAVFHQQLSYCVTQFVDKDPTLAAPVLLGIIKYWPVTNSSKEVLFLNELEELLELTQPEEFRKVLVPLFKNLAKAIGSPHFQVAERALFLWHNEYISGLIADHRKEVLSIIFPVLHINSQQHWNPTVNNLTLNVLKIFMELDSQLVEKCSKQYAETNSTEVSHQQQRRDNWKRLDAKVVSK